MEHQKRPTVSVVVPVYNSARYLRLTLESVLRQTFTDWEMILVDDASTDDSREIAREYANRDERIRLVCSETNRGAAETRNAGIRESTGEHIALLDSDDLWRPRKLERQLALARANDAQIVYCSYGIIDPAGQPACGDFIVPARTDLDRMLVRSVISCSTALIRADVLKEHPFRTDFYHEDYVLWLELLRAGCSNAGCREVLADYRLSEGSRSGNKKKSAVERWRVYRDYLHMPLLPSARAWLAYAAAGLKKYKEDR